MNSNHNVNNVDFKLQTVSNITLDNAVSSANGFLLVWNINQKKTIIAKLSVIFISKCDLLHSMVALMIRTEWVKANYIQ